MRPIDADALISDMQERYCKPCKERKEDYNQVRCRACWVDDAINDVDGFADNAIEAVSEWIPCSERMPSEDGWYLIALAFEWGIEYEAGRWEDGIWWNPNSHVNVAWMPLPKPYEETEQ